MKNKRVVSTLTLTGLALFTAITLFLSTSVIWDLFGVRAQQGHYVPLVIWSNFLCGILYIIALIGLFFRKKWTLIPLVVALFILIGAFVGLYIHISQDDPYETKTISALFLRIFLTLLIVFGSSITTKNLK